VQSLKPEQEDWIVTVHGEEIRASRVVLAIPAPKAAQVLRGLGADAVAETLQSVEHARIGVVHMGFNDLRLPPGFGFLMPPTEPAGERTPRALGILFSSNIFPKCAPAGSSSTTSIYDAAALDSLDDNEAIEFAREDLRRGLGLDAAPVSSTGGVVRWQDVIPRYAVGHAERMQQASDSLAESCSGLHLVGNYMGGVSVEDRIRCGRELATRVAQQELAEVAR
jgi:oxygen-dependent protoporphyrinogen oxidase